MVSFCVAAPDLFTHFLMDEPAVVSNSHYYKSAAQIMEYWHTAKRSWRERTQQDPRQCEPAFSAHCSSKHTKCSREREQIQLKAMCTLTIYACVQIPCILLLRKKCSVKSTFFSAVHGAFTKSDHTLDRCCWRYKTLVLEMERKNLETFMQFERRILFLLEIIKSWCSFFKKKKKSSTKKCYKHYWGIFLRDEFLEVELLDQWHRPLNVNSYGQVASIYLLPGNTPRAHLSACSLTTLAISKATALFNIFLSGRLKDTCCLLRIVCSYPQPIFY